MCLFVWCWVFSQDPPSCGCKNFPHSHPAVFKCFFFVIPVLCEWIHLFCTGLPFFPIRFHSALRLRNKWTTWRRAHWTFASARSIHSSLWTPRKVLSCLYLGHLPKTIIIRPLFYIFIHFSVKKQSFKQATTKFPWQHLRPRLITGTVITAPSGSYVMKT